MLDADAHFQEVRKSIDRGEGSGWSKEGVRAQLAIRAVALQKRHPELSDLGAFDKALALNPDMVAAYYRRRLGRLRSYGSGRTFCGRR
jgi:hypothetical protein